MGYDILRADEASKIHSFAVGCDQMCLEVLGRVNDNLANLHLISASAGV